MGTIKTRATDESVTDFLNAVEHEQRREDAFVILELLKKITKMEPKMWGPTMIGFGQYHYKSERSSQEGDWPLMAFSPRKQAQTIYIMPGFDGYSEQLKKLGKHKTSVGCLYINKLDDIDMKVLEELLRTTFEEMKKKQ